jgi:hypothetical protein
VAPIRLAVERQVERVLAERLGTRGGLLHFEETIEVRAQTPEELLARFLTDLRRPGGGGSPSVDEMKPFRAHPADSIDLLPLLGLLRKRIQASGRPRFFIYELHEPNGDSFVLRDRLMPASGLYLPGGRVYQLVDSFSDEKEAVAALKRLERHGPLLTRPTPEP